MQSLSAFQRLLMIALGLLLGFSALGVLLILRGPGDTPLYLPEVGEVYAREDADLGRVPRRGIVTRSVRRSEGQTLYDVRYTIGANGLRATPGSGIEGPAIVFFGGSFMFGEGVEDDETLPAYVAAKLGGRSVLNAGFHGYGPHQMLRSLEQGRLEVLVPEGVDEVVYLGIEGHEARAAGRVTWDIAGPRYELRDGIPVYDGPFHRGLPWFALKAARRVGLLRNLVAASLRADAEETAADRERYAAIIARAAALAQERWGARFTVLFWDSAESDLPEFLESRGLKVLRVSEALGEGGWKAWMIPGDGHPAAPGHAAMARLLVAYLNGRSP
jgi:hypothetical protein